MKRAWQSFPQKNMYKTLACEFHPTLIIKFYTDETSMARFVLIDF
ncbi:MAG: hypothetical protein JG782_676 [Anaerophaga sp.]|nr:hypothetical protein [Anaerophaga sp.]